MAVLPVEVDVKIRKLKSIESLPKGYQPPPNEEQIVAQKLRVIADTMTVEIENRLNETSIIEAVPESEIEQAQAVLQVKLSGYGKIKRKWLFYLIGSGVIEGTTEGVIAGLAVSNPWVAAGIAGEEVAQEAVTWGGGAFMFDRIFTPVIFDAKLISLYDRHALWKKLAFARINHKALKKYSKEERKKKELRLRLASEKALDVLVKGLVKKTRRAL